jgi:hypothetical protein
VLPVVSPVLLLVAVSTLAVSRQKAQPRVLHQVPVLQDLLLHLPVELQALHQVIPQAHPQVAPPVMLLLVVLHQVPVMLLLAALHQDLVALLLSHLVIVLLGLLATLHLMDQVLHQADPLLIAPVPLLLVALLPALVPHLAVPQVVGLVHLPVSLLLVDLPQAQVLHRLRDHLAPQVHLPHHPQPLIQLCLRHPLIATRLHPQMLLMLFARVMVLL